MAGHVIPGIEVESMRLGHCRDHGSPWFGSPCTTARNTYEHTVDDIVPLFAGSSMSIFVEDDDDWTLVEIPLSNNAAVHASLHFDFTAIQTQCCEFSLAVSDKAGDVLGLALKIFEGMEK